MQRAVARQLFLRSFRGWWLAPKASNGLESRHLRVARNGLDAGIAMRFFNRVRRRQRAQSDFSLFRGHRAASLDLPANGKSFGESRRWSRQW